MTMTYRIRLRRPRLLWPFWTSHLVVGHRYDSDQDKLVLFFPDGGLREVARWKDCEVKLGPDWVLAQKKAMEAQSGQPIPVNLGGNH